MAVKVRWKGKDYKDVELSGGEIREAERTIGEDMDAWSRLTITMVGIYASVQRVAPDAITWAELDAMPVSQILDCYVDDAPKRGRAPLDRQPAKKAAARKSPPRKRPATRRAAGSGSTSAAPSTSST